MCDCYECKIRGATSASESADALAREVKDLANAELNGRRREFYQEMILNSGDALELLEDEGYTEDRVRELDFDAVQTLYEREDVYGAIWMGGSVEEDNAHQKDDYYHEGYEHGACMVLRHLNKLFGIEP